MDGTTNAALAFLLLDAVAVALAVELGRIVQRGETITIAGVRVFILVLALLALAFAAFSFLAACCLALAYLLRKCFVSSATPSR